MSGENEVEYPTETMTTLANTKQTKWDADATEGVRKLRDALADRSTFGDLPVLASYGSVFEEVRTIYLETVRGAKADLEAVAQGIRTSAQQMKDRDDQAGAAFVELWQRWQNGPLESTRSHQQAASTESAQTAAQTADAAEGGTQPAGDAGAGTPIGETGDAQDETSDTRDEGAIPTGDATSVAGDHPGTTTHDVIFGRTQPPHVQ